MNEEMSGDEVMVLLVSVVISGVAAVRWYWQVARVTAFGAPAGQRFALSLAPPLCLGFLFLVLLNLAAKEVRGDFRYIALFLAAGGAWLRLSLWAFSLLGVSFREDCLEQRNPAAIVALCGGLAGVTCIFAGGNIGEGPSIWNTFYSAGVATLVFFVLCMLQELVTRSSDAVVIDRDLASGIRLGALLFGVGLIHGRSVAGNWVSAAATLRYFAGNAWPALILLVFGAGLHLFLRPNPANPKPSVLTGVVPAIIYVALAVFYVVALGDWNPPPGGSNP